MVIKLNNIKNCVLLLDQVIKFLMGKSKTKYPVIIVIQFILPLDYEIIISKQVQLTVHMSPLTYENIKKPYEQFLIQNNINYPTLIQWYQDECRQQIGKDFKIDITKILEDFQGTFTIYVYNQLAYAIEQITLDIQDIRLEIQQIKDRLDQLPTKQQISLFKKNSLPALNHNQSNYTPMQVYEQKQIDLGVLFSQPIFDELKKDPAAYPVDFRSEIQRLHLALKSSIKPNVSLKCQIATKQNLKHLVKYSKPKILHIICHGTIDGALQFQDDSRSVLGNLQVVGTQEIFQLLKNSKQLPDIVFINSCYSQKIGQAFYQMGVNYVISIDSQDTIEDEAAQIFSQHFYRNIFSGQKVKQAFKQAKQTVKLKHNSFGCCCRHSSKEKHKPNCRWLQMIGKKPNSDIIDVKEKLEKHKLFHVPSDLCKCELKNLNRHNLTCEWARQALFHINNDFRVKDQNGGYRFPKTKLEYPPYLYKNKQNKYQLVICCCFNYEGGIDDKNQPRLPHSQSNKFKIMESNNSQKPQNVFNIVPSPFKQLNDYTSPQLVETHEKIDSSVRGRQKQIYEFIKRIKDLSQNIYLVYGQVGVGRTSFVLKCVTYMIQRRVFQMYFYIDLYGIKDRDIFRYKFNQITKFNYDGGQIKLSEVKNKMMIIILDNADDFFELQKDQLYDQLKLLRQELHKTKIILTLKQENSVNFDFQKIHSQKYGLKPLKVGVATKFIFQKMRHLFDVTVQYIEIYGLVQSNPSLTIPKNIESIVQAFSSNDENNQNNQNSNKKKEKKIKISQLKQKIQSTFKGDQGGNRLIQENINILKTKSQASYQLLLFISQFSEGISIDDLKILSLYDKKDSRVHLPITKNWQSSFSALFDKIKMEDSEKQSTQSESVSTQQVQPGMNPPLKNSYSIMNTKELQIQKISRIQKIVTGQSYFLDQVSQNRFIVKRFIRDFIWKKHQSSSNYHMKHLFVGYMAIMLEVYFKWLVNSKLIHEDLFQYSSVSQAGLFGFKNNIFNVSMSLTESVRIAKQYNSQFQRIVNEHPTILQKIKKSDPSIFVANHKQDFLNIYQKQWNVVFGFLKQNNRMQDKICMGYLQNLMLFIPTAFKIAKIQTSLLKYVISKSMNLLVRLQKYSEQQKYAENQKILAIQLKLQLMQASIDIQKTQIDTLKNNLDFNQPLTINLIKKITDTKILQFMRKYWTFQKTYILMYKQYLSKKEIINRFSQEKSKISFQKLKIMIQNVIEWLAQNWQDAQQILYAKRNLLIGLFYLCILKNTTGSVSVHAKADKLKKQNQKNILKLVNESVFIFKSKDLMKLCLRAKLTIVEINTWPLSQRKKSKTELGASKITPVYQQLAAIQKQVIECQKIYTDRKNNLLAFAEFDIEIKTLKNLLKQKLWQQSSNTLVCMKPVPLTINGKEPLIQNLARKKNRFRKEIQKVVNPQTDLCSKFQILTKAKLKQELQNGCTVLLLTANVKMYNNKPCLVFQGPRLEQDLLQINLGFTQQFDMKNIKILIIAGDNSSLGIKKLNQILDDPPLMISLGNIQIQSKNHSFTNFMQENYEYSQKNHLLKIEQKKQAQVSFLRQFVKKLMERQITTKQQVVQICIECQETIRKVLQLKVEFIKRKSDLKISHKKGSYKDLSPGYQKNHNIDMKVKSSDSTNFVCLRRWKQTYRIFQYLHKLSMQAQKAIQQNKQPETSGAYINVFGDIGSGKSTFVQQTARIFVQRQKFKSGVYVIDGKVLQKKYQGQLQAYFNKESQSGKIMTLQDFQTNGNENLMLILDDFNAIKPRSNGRFNLFLQKIVDKKVNLIIVTNSLYQSDHSVLKSQQTKQFTSSTFFFKRIKPIRIDRLCPFEIDLIAYNTLDLKNKKLFEKYQQLHDLKKQTHTQLTMQDIYSLKSNFYGKKRQREQSIEQERQMKKLQSYQS